MAIAKKTPAAPAAASTSAKAPAAAKEVMKKAAEKAAEPVAKAPEPTPAAAPAAETTEDAASLAIADLEAKLSSAAALLKEATAALKTIKKENDRLKKVVAKVERKRANARTTPSGFAKPTKLSDELCAFLGIPAGSELSRTEVTRKINAYVKEHNLNDPANKRIILPDAKLKKLLKVKDTDSVSFFNLQKYLSPCFIKAQ